MPSGNYEIWIGDDLYNSYNDKGDAVRTARSVAKSHPDDKVYLWHVSRTEPNPRGQGTHIAPKLVDYRHSFLKCVGGRHVKYGSDE